MTERAGEASAGLSSGGTEAMPTASVEAGTDDEGNEYILEAQLEEVLSHILQAGLTDEPAAI